MNPLPAARGEVGEGFPTYFLRFATLDGFFATLAARFGDATRTDRAGLAVRFAAFAAGG